MNPMIIGAVLDVGKRLLDKVIPDPVERAKAQVELLKLQQEGAFKELDAELQRNLAQIEVNKVEAASDSRFKSWARPAALWVCVAGLGYEFILRPLLPWTLTVTGVSGVPPLPSLDDVLMELLFALLGLGAFRSIDKFRRGP